jgi:hypothetical protein
VNLDTESREVLFLKLACQVALDKGGLLVDSRSARADDDRNDDSSYLASTTVADQDKLESGSFAHDNSLAVSVVMISMGLGGGSTLLGSWRMIGGGGRSGG